MINRSRVCAHAVRARTAPRPGGGATESEPLFKMPSTLKYVPQAGLGHRTRSTLP
jgi:hypothetical protein